MDRTSHPSLASTRDRRSLGWALFAFCLALVAWSTTGAAQQPPPLFGPPQSIVEPQAAPLPPLLNAPDSVFSNAQRAEPSLPMLPPPSSDRPRLAPLPAEPEVVTPQYTPADFGEQRPPFNPLFSEDALQTEFHNVLGQKVDHPPVFRQLTYRKTFLPPGSQLFGMVDITIEGSIAPRTPIFGAPILLTPFFTFHFFEQPQVVQTPEQVYDTGMEIRQVRRVAENLWADVAVAPSVYSDFRASEPNMFRVVGRGVALWDVSPDVQLALGAVYLGRDDIKVLPIFGAVWRPDEATELEAIYPRPRFARRFTPPSFIEKCSRHKLAPLLGFTPVQQYWAYVSGELGGNTWAVQQNGVNDRLTYYDLRLVLGIEQRAAIGPRGRIEVGYVFNRDVSYLSGPITNLHDTFMLRGELAH